MSTEYSGAVVVASKKFRGEKSLTKVTEQFAKQLENESHPFPTLADDVRERLAPIGRADKGVLQGRRCGQFRVVTDGNVFCGIYVMHGQRTSDEESEIQTERKKALRR